MTSVSEISEGQLLLGPADATIASEEGEICMGNMTTGYFADLSATSEDNSSVPPRLSRLRRKSFEAAASSDLATRLSSTSSESRSEGEVIAAKPDSKSPA